MDKQAEKLVKACYPCQLVGQRPKPEPLRPTKLPEGPWSDIAVDLLDITGCYHLLVVTDYYSRWPEVACLQKTNASNVIKCMESMFQRHGIPDRVRSDNGPPFASREFEGFLEYLGIEHRKGIPYSPESNGEVERFNATILKIVRIAKIENKDWNREVENFLFQYRTTPHGVTGLTPSELLMGRKLKDKLPKIQAISEQLCESDWQILLRDRDARRKMKEKEYADRRRQ